MGTQASSLWHCDTTVGDLHKQTQRFQIMFFHRFNETIHSYLGHSGKKTLSVSPLFPKDMFALYEWFMLSTTITCRPLRSFFLFPFSFIFYVHKKKLYIHCYLWEKLFFVHLHSYDELFLYTRIKTLSLYINTVYIQTLFLFKDFFFIFFNTHL